ncbi:ATP-dependent DNA helicase pcrA [Cordyceps fumosorosea ARSEF 2679]|uniref:DNA 3'-5' helicase n=1 Tax=Cordyceps fumosorosea (strain ARSEF 2679) TaxID=1081104 RepID=A0A167SCD0_CORFA|nr:ATP-dependent DNA helicase pcrA [Cordyceps fumosorosea ARSEF 2679]OAA59486.1 ATP-dependent DNA helicase pcrA [Cordyceps fumosorosea ARSEF 2679]
MAATSGQHDVLASLNTAQRRAVTSSSNTVAILAGPGSGKTHTLTSRVVWLIQEAGLRPSDMIVATFTVKASKEMKERIGRALGDGVQKKIVLGTFHSIARRYLIYYGKHIGLDPKFGIADDNDSRAILKRLIKRLGLQLDPAMAKGWISKRKSRGSLDPPVERHPDGTIKRDNPELLQCFAEYQSNLSTSNLLDYDDLLICCVDLLRAYPICVSNIQVVLVDEYQDTNGIQYELMKLFAQERRRITIVGDPDQSIYGWRSAEIRNLHRLQKDFPSTDEISLEENYRSSQSILTASLSVIQQESSRYDKLLLPIHGKGTTPVLRRLRSAEDEGQWIVGEIERARLMTGGMLKGEDCAILLRSASLSRHVESALGRRGIPYRMIGGHKFYERKEIKILLDYLRVVHQPNSNDAVSRIINVPKRGVGEVTIKNLLEEAEIGKLPLWQILEEHCQGNHRVRLTKTQENNIRGGLIRAITSLRKQVNEVEAGEPQPLVEVIQKLITQLDYKSFLEKEFGQDHEGRWANVEEFVNMATDFMMENSDLDGDALPEIDDAEQSNNDTMLGRFLANITLSADAQKDQDGVDTSAVVTISTIHAAKGLEWPVVFVPCVYDGSIPHSRSEDDDEERRLLYVAMTRAKVLLYLSCPTKTAWGHGDAVLSCFLSSFAATAFADQGPSFDRQVVEDMAKTLRRSAPSEKAIFDNLPPMFAVEDDLFDTDPFGQGRRLHGPTNSRLGYRVGNNLNGNQPQCISSSSDSSVEEIGWKPVCKTTMGESSGFTTLNLPGFMTASARQSMVVAEAAEKRATTDKEAKKTGAKRKHDQHSLLGYAETRSGRLVAKRPAAAFASAMQPPTSSSRPTSIFQAPPPAIEPSLSRHRIAQRPMLPEPGRACMPTTRDSPKKNYACFSSSPTRPEPAKEVTIKQPSAPLQPAPSKTISLLQNTTSFQAGKIGGMRRPVGMGARLESGNVRKPFKPLTLNRPTK